MSVPETINQYGEEEKIVWVCDTVYDSRDEEWRTEEFTGTVTVYHVRTGDQKFNKNTILCRSYGVEDTTRFAPITTMNIPVKYEPETG